MTFWNGPSEAVDGSVAVPMPQYITQFAMYGNPNEKGVSRIEVYGKDANVQVLKSAGFGSMRDPAANRRCEWWQKALYAQSV